MNVATHVYRQDYILCIYVCVDAFNIYECIYVIGELIN